MGRARASRITHSAIAVTLACLTGLTGCAASPQPAATAPATVAPPTPAATDYVASLLRTRDLGSARTLIEVSTTRGDATTDLSGEGGVVFTSGFGQITWTDPTGDVTIERSNGKGLFVQSDPPTGTWTRYTGTDQTSTGRLTDVLRGLGTLQGVRSEGSDRLGDLPVERYRGTMPVTAGALGQLGLSAKESAALAASADSSVIDVTVYIDEAGRVAGVDRSVDIGGSQPVRSVVRTRLGDFSAPLDISPPATQSVVQEG